MECTRKSLFFSVCTLVIFISSSALAAPVIDNVSGDLLSGQTLTVYGSGFGVKSPAAPVLWENFESGKLEASFDKVDPLWEVYGGEGQRLGSSYSYRADRGNGVASVDLRKDYIIQDKLYTYVKRRWDFDFIGRNQKVFRVWQSNGVQSVGWNYLSVVGKLQYFTRDGFTKHIGVGTTPGYYTRISPEAHPSPGTWKTEEFFIRLESAIDACDGVLAYVVKEGLHKFWPENRCMFDAEHNLPFEQIYLDNFGTCEGGGHDCLPVGSYVWVDDIYIDNTWARVVVGNQPLYVDCNQIEIQPPVSWDDAKGEIVITLNQGAFDTLEGKYLFVIDADNAPSAGFLLGSTPKRPGIPKDIRAEGAIPSTL